MNANGNEQLPEYRKRMIEAANEAYQAVASERDDLERQLHDMTLKYEGEKMKLEQMQNLVNMMESTIASHRLERDSAVRENARLEAALTNCFVVLQRHLKGQD
jgi:chromosome segregation ATPase